MTVPNKTVPKTGIEAQLEQLTAQVSQLVENQRVISESLSELSPIVMSVMKAGAVQFGELEEKGYFTFGSQAVRALDKVVQAYSEEDLDRFGDNIVAILDTVRNVTQPDVLDFANEATDAIHGAGDAKPVGGVWGMYKASKDDDMQRGMAVMFEMLRQVGKGAKKAQSGNRRHTPKRRTPVGLLPDASKMDRVSRPERKAPAPAMAGDGRFDANGFLADPASWDRALGTELASKMGIELTDAHWAVIEWVRADYFENDASPNVRRISTGSGLDTRGIYGLFPKAPGKTIALIAGIPKPGGCL
jgi:tRNA 2-thiouridine synthesizing protein E